MTVLHSVTDEKQRGANQIMNTTLQTKHHMDII